MQLNLFDFDSKTDGLYDIILVDGSHLLHRAAHAYTLGIQRGDTYIPTGAVYGFLKMVQTLKGKFADSPCKIIFCWEGGYKHRTDLYPNYKISRRKKTELADEDQQLIKEAFKAEFSSQRKLLEDFLAISGWYNCRVQNYEADDVIASLCKHFDNGENRIAIYSGDGDLHQCVNERIHAISAGSGYTKEKIYKVGDVMSKWGVIPTRIPLVKALSGDKSDDIPGCDNCGPGWASKILNTYKDLDEIYEHIENGGILVGEYKGKKWQAKKVSGKLHHCKENVYISEKLAKVVDTLECEIVKSPLDTKAISAFFNSYEFYSFDLADFVALGK